MRGILYIFITEKLFRPLDNFVVPVVYATKDVRKIAPPNSYIDVRDFKSPKHLAEYLLYLDKNDTAYMEYFNWRRDYRVKSGPRASLFCQLCRFLHTNNSPKIMDFNFWFFNKSECNDPYKEINFT